MFFLYLHDDLGLLESLKTAWRRLFSKKFWPIVGSTATMYFIINIIQSSITMIPYFFLLFGTILSASEQNSKGSLITLLVSGLYIVSIALAYVLYNAIMINQGLIFYSFKEQEEHAQAFSEIDLIGQNAE